MRTYSLDDVYETRKRRDSWWTVYFVDPVACRVALPVANRTRLTPNSLTVLSLVLGMASAVCFGTNQLVAGACVFYLSFMIDCVDGKIARLKGTGTPFGLWLDYVGDRVRVVLCAAGLAYGQYALTGDVRFILLGAAVAVLDLFRYVNAPQMKRVREIVREARLGPLTAQELERLEQERLERLPRGRSFPKRFNRFLARHRVRSHLISGIEFHAAVFVVAPLAGAWALIPLSVLAGVLLLVNEIFLVYRMWRFTRRHRVASSQESREHVLV
ncbi:CDP-alcohol phosphatidyltransferase family protein [Nonomuraea sp. K274]|uniref:CDP-alcohol phosphatidyltransferase family protein n=1 Tax=Nonomuraea cypriaca TaxID=1187855 RepID=A0A931AE86_9ACTN|nr:CDP-alcohol phosphatidyltransferase family protein [Nonomuraea cypriaca]MBF8187637.1 CDP-alcohol phosphatidyltransferase family protein [Nonomuraea cypriaca]